MKSGSLLVAFIILIIATNAPTQTGVPYGQEFQINTYTHYNQNYPAIAGFKDGGFVVCWDSYLQDGSKVGVYGQVFNSDCSKRGTEFQVHTYTQHQQRFPATATLNDGGFVVCWVNEGPDGADANIHAQLFNADGSKRGDEFRVNTDTCGWQLYPTVVSLGSGGFVVCWQSHLLDYTTHNIHAQIFTSQGNRQGTEFRINTDTGNKHGEPSAASLSDGGFVVCWGWWSQDNTEMGILAQFFDQNGSKRGSEIRVISYSGGRLFVPEIAAFHDGSFIVSWYRTEENRKADIYAQLINSDGSKRGTEFRVNTCTNNSQVYPTVSTLSNDDFIIAWHSFWQDGSDSGVYAQLFKSDGRKIGKSF